MRVTIYSAVLSGLSVNSYSCFLAQTQCRLVTYFIEGPERLTPLNSGIFVFFCFGLVFVLFCLVFFLWVFFVWYWETLWYQLGLIIYHNLGL